MKSEKAGWLKRVLLLTFKEKADRVKRDHENLNRNWENVWIFNESTFQSYSNESAVWY